MNRNNASDRVSVSVCLCLCVCVCVCVCVPVYQVKIFISYIVGENLQETAIREVREETGIETEFVSLLCFRHMHEVRWGTDDLYFVCLLKPLSSEVKMDGKEISACKWIDVSNIEFTV